LTGAPQVYSLYEIVGNDNQVDMADMIEVKDDIVTVRLMHAAFE